MTVLTRHSLPAAQRSSRVQRFARSASRSASCQHNLRDVGVAGSNPVTPTIDCPSYFISDHVLGVSFTYTLVQIWCEFRRLSTNWGGPIQAAAMIVRLPFRPVAAAFHWVVKFTPVGDGGWSKRFPSP